MLAGMHQPKLTFSALILVDPMIFFKPPSREDAAMTVDLAGGAAKRRDIWASREEAFKSLQSRPSFKVWDPRILEIFIVSKPTHRKYSGCYISCSLSWMSFDNGCMRCRNMVFESYRQLIIRTRPSA